jgi:DNA modification methylase
MIQYLRGDCRQVLTSLPKSSVHCCITSPPYWGLRDYGVDGQLGLERTPGEYVQKMVEVFRLVRRILRDDATLWINMGDSYVSNPGNGRGGEGVDGGTPHRSGRDKTGCGLKTKDLAGMPWRLAFALQEDGWYLRSDIIWNKPNAMPESVTDRPTKAHEYIFLLAKSERYFYDADAIREPFATTDAHRATAEWVKGWATDGAHNAIAHNVPKSHRGSKFGSGKTAKLTTGSGPRSDHALGRNKRSVWTVSTQPYAQAHFATFPPELIRPCIKAGCPAGGTVLDPFGGSGTTGLVAEQEGRNAILIELNPDYIELQRQRTQQASLAFAA